MQGLQEISFDSAVQSLREKAASFSQTYQQLVSLRPIAVKDAALYDEWNTVKSRAETAMNTVNWINRQVDSAANWLGNVFGLNGMNGVGAIPLIPIAYVTAAIAALSLIGNSMLSTIAKTYELKRKLDLIQAGQAGSDILNTPDTSITGQIGSAVKWVIIGAALYYIVPKVLERVKK